ncbi:ATP-grasp domain-containing protein [Methanosalsum natronophilum]|uniref:ATP-grasp domain-containing protein n=1 Tax=Methanosalsum natronophilum TaxID=768733 RepID=A0A424Z3E4_9EURY|nr:MAG: ATP-grasp domain-containing protein [Methanosalsum natronophilum]
MICMKNVLIIGFSSRNIVKSANNAGYNVYSIDSFCDFDCKYYSQSTRIIDLGDKTKSCIFQEIHELTKSFNVEFDFAILGAGFEHIDFSEFSVPVLNNKYDVLEKVSNKLNLSKELSKLNIPHPKIYCPYDIEECVFPLIAKPILGGGGTFNQKLEDLEDYYKFKDYLEVSCGKLTDFILQDFVEGVPASVSLISAGSKSVPLSINEQLIGIEWLGSYAYTYCGNITPLKNFYSKQMEKIAANISNELNLFGSNGVDFILTKNGPIVIEVNARFQGSLDTVELATNLNLFNAHVNSFRSILPSVNPLNSSYAGKAVAYAVKDFVVTDSIFETILGENSSDIPNKGDFICTGDPITSIIKAGFSRHEVLQSLWTSSKTIYNSINTSGEVK